MGTARLRIAIIGCGTAGPAAAAMLAADGHDCEVFERAPDCRPVGAGFLLQPSGMDVLARLGVLDDVLAHASRVESLHITKRDGGTLLQLAYREIGGGRFGAGLHRPVLLHFLMRAMERAGATSHWGCDITGLEREGATWRLSTADGRAFGGYDLVLLCDGARSRLRQHAHAGGINRGYPWGAHWFIGENRGCFPEDQLYQVVRGTSGLVGFLATGRDLGGGEPLVSIFYSIRLDQDAALRAQPLEEWKTRVLDLCPRAEPLLGRITGWEEILTAAYGDVRMPRWHGPGIVALGDAGHAMSPQLGQGVNLALADAACLADCLKAGPPGEALRIYQKRRRFAVRYYQLATRWLTPWFQSGHEWLAPPRRVFFAVAGRVPPARRLMIRTMAGLVGHRTGA
jgi:2-polyprenyl-6-methoxyphenol hydroxylase-like FAD-dependent oxidoreductase